jgi:hypothetical protein
MIFQTMKVNCDVMNVNCVAIKITNGMTSFVATAMRCYRQV